MKVIELLIDDEEDLAGGNAIALVEHPAHEEDFFQFSKDKKEIVPTDEQQTKILHQFSAVGQDHQHFMMEGHFIKSIDPVGDFNIGRIDDKFSSVDIGNPGDKNDVLGKNSIMDFSDGLGSYKVRFKYVVRPGRPAVIQTTRNFCRQMINANKIYRLEDINKILNGFKSEYPGVGNWGDTFLRFGGPNCNHIFVKITYQEIFKKDKPTGQYANKGEQSRDDAALEAGSNLNAKTAANPSPQTVRRAGLGMFAKEDVVLNDYPEAAVENAKRVLKYLEESGNPNNCLTQVGKVRANQIANKENLSEETINRMKSFLSRHAGNERTGGARSYDEGCSNIALDAWGGLEILPWVEKKLKQFEEFKFAEEQSKQQLLAGPVLIPDKMIYRREPVSNTEYYVYFSKDTVKKIAFKYLRDKNISNVNIEHNPKNSLDDVALVESWIVTDPKNDKSNQYGYELPEGTWFGIVQVKDKEIFQKYVESGAVKGFSLEGYFEQKLVKFHDTKFDTDTYILSEIENLLKQ